MALTPRQAAFVAEYLVDLNATKAAIRSGYSEKTAHSIGHENLSKPEIQQALTAAMQDRAERTQVTQDMVIAELAKIGFSDLRKVMTDAGALIPVQEWEDDMAGAISSVEIVRRPNGERDENDRPIIEDVVKLRVWDKLNALEKLGKHLGMFGGDGPREADPKPFDGWHIEEAS
jgi:phage terminase small subunit